MSFEKTDLPDMEINFPGRKHDSRVLLLAGGRPPGKKWLDEAAGASDVIWAVDRGADICASFGIIPELVIGDMDSISPDALSWIESRGISVERYPVEKDLTDLQLAVNRLGETYTNTMLLISGVFGGRLDHTLSNLFTGVWGLKSGMKSLVLGDDREMVTVLEGPSKLILSFSEIPSDISLLALSETCRGVSITGTVWELLSQDLDMYRPYAVSNRIESNFCPVVIEVESGWLGVYVNQGKTGCIKQPV